MISIEPLTFQPLSLIGACIMTGYTIACMHTIVNSKTSGFGTKILQSITAIARGVLLCAGSVWFVYTKLAALIIESTYIIFSEAGKEKVDDMLQKLDIHFSVGVALAIAVFIGMLVSLSFYGAMTSWGFAV
jgi:hypothetical protein